MITDKTYSIEIKWIKKSAIISSPGLAIAFACILGGVFNAITSFSSSQISLNNFNFKIIIVLFVVGIIVNPPLIYLYLILFRKNFKYELGERLLIFKQGILSKSERIVPYGRIQHIVISQDLIDKLMGLASIIIETASEGGGAKLSQEAPSSLFFGFASNRIIIPGLLYRNALEFKDILLELVKKNPIDDAQSGL